MAITASLGVAVIILTNLFLLPIMASFVSFPADYQNKLNIRAKKLLPVWRYLASLTRPSDGEKSFGCGLCSFSCFILARLKNQNW